MSNQELINRIEASLRGLQYVDTNKQGNFRAINHSHDFYYGVGYTHIDGKRHDRYVCSANLLSSLYRAYVHSFSNVERGRTNMAKLNGLL